MGDPLPTLPEFQSTHPRGVRLELIGPYFIDTKFQSTHPRGVRLNPVTPLVIMARFQSTHPRGVRPGL